MRDRWKEQREPSVMIAGTGVILDLHGYSVRQGLAVAGLAVEEAYRRGLKTVELIHGYSTSHGWRSASTLKWALGGAVRRGEFLEWAWNRRSRQHVFKQGSMILALKATRVCEASTLEVED